MVRPAVSASQLTLAATGPDPPAITRRLVEVRRSRGPGPGWWPGRAQAAQPLKLGTLAATWVAAGALRAAPSAWQPARFR
jgi:hypothetical protein